MLAALLADQMMVMLARRVIFVVELAFAGADWRHKSDRLQLLQGAVHRGDLRKRLLRHDRRVNLLGSDVMAVRLDHLEYLKALWR